MANTENVGMIMSQHKMSDPELNNDVMLYYNFWKNVTFVWILYKYGYEFHNLLFGLISLLALCLSICVYVYLCIVCRHVCLCVEAYLFVNCVPAGIWLPSSLCGSLHL